MADIASAKSKMNDVEINADAPLSEALHEKLGANINYLIDTTDTHETRLDSLDELTSNRTDVNYSTTGALPTTETTIFTTSSITVPDGGRVLFLFHNRSTATILPNSTSAQGFSASVFKVFGVGSGTVTVRFKRGSTSIITATQSWDLAGSNPYVVLGNFSCIDAPSAGSYTYSLTWDFSSSVADVVQSAIGTVTHIVIP